VPDIDVKLQWHSPDRVFAAVLVRDGEPWYLNGALVGMSGDPGDAVAELIEQAIHMVTTGESLLMEGEIELADRIWLFKLLDQGSLANDTMYAAVRDANGGVDPYIDSSTSYITKTGQVMTESDIYDLAQEAEEGYDIPLCGHRWYEMPQPGEEPNAGPEHPAFVVRTCTLGKNHRKPVDHHDKNAPNA